MTDTERQGGGAEGPTPLHWAAAREPASAAGKLLEAGAAPNAKDNETGATPLHVAAGQGHGRVVRLLIAAGANVNAVNNQGDTPLFLATENGNAAAIGILEQAGGKY